MTLCKLDVLSVPHLFWMLIHYTVLSKIYIDFIPRAFTRLISNLLFSLMIKCQVFHSNHSKSFHIYATEKLIFSSRIPLPLPHERCRRICLNMIYIYIWLLVEKCSSGYRSHPEFYLAFEEGNCHATLLVHWHIPMMVMKSEMARKSSKKNKVKT